MAPASTLKSAERFPDTPLKVTRYDSSSKTSCATSAAPQLGAAEEQARTDWSDWWRTDRPSAESFLNAAAWPDDLKFRARAKAFFSAP